MFNNHNNSTTKIPKKNSALQSNGTKAGATAANYVENVRKEFHDI